MTTSSHRTSDPRDKHGSEPEFDLLAREPLADSCDRVGVDAPFDQDRLDDHAGASYTDADYGELYGGPSHAHVAGEIDNEAGSAAWQPHNVRSDDDLPATEYVSMPGMPGRGVILLTTVSAGGCAGLDFVLTGTLTIFFDLCFVVVCLVATMAVRRHDIFTTGVLPPLVFAAVIGAVALIAPSTFVATGALSTVFLTGLTQHAWALIAGYGVALLTVGGRIGAQRRA
jgi:uncharacterized protein DUF6542